MTGVSECSQQRGNLKDDGYILFMMKYHSIVNVRSSHLVLPLRPMHATASLSSPGD
ncbi:hypothetical protein [Photorhabdus laumondii]|uniref:hypothetical protein n=1 Tax=Photorhabdus laumondii TaxID=2218628 RepID=UPI00138AF062|nr:hypothetical protein [Photorhabdus laumondii]NDL47017.1 hypothetical protein [Photorhabdus laumondii subsp. laumondii]